MTAEQIRHARDLLTRPDNTVSSIARLLGVSRATIYKYVPELPARPASCGPAPRAEVMKTGEVQDTGDGAEPHLEVDGWTPWLDHAPEDELERYYSTANALMMRLERMPPPSGPG